LADWQRRHQGLDRLATDWSEQAAALAARTWPCGLSVSRGLLLSLGVSDGASLEPVLLFLADHRREAARAMEQLGDWTVEVLSRAVQSIDFDYLVCGEPLASQHAPVISPGMFEELMGGFYLRITRLAAKAGIPVVIWESYGAISSLLPAVVAAGFNTIWIGHAAASGVDYLAVRRRYPQLGLIGGLDSRLLQRPELVESELAQVARPLLASGRYVPMLDDRLRPGVSATAFGRYRTALNALLAEA
ncbi:MAG: hypothetical protein HUU35_11355, partial [Armatimonadetes bacterium]|nr:hypothetical protein [Armatimonadota bacterium]